MYKHAIIKADITIYLKSKHNYSIFGYLAGLTNNNDSLPQQVVALQQSWIQDSLRAAKRDPRLFFLLFQQFCFLVSLVEIHRNLQE